jgi:hypothetical protein
MNTKGILVDRGLLTAEPTWFPYTAAKFDSVLTLFRGVVRGNLPTTVKAFIKLLRSDKRRT